MSVTRTVRLVLILTIATILRHAGANAVCGGDCTAVSPIENVPINLDQSSAVHIQVEASVEYRFWAHGDSWHAPDCGGRYSAVLLASGYQDADLLAVPIGTGLAVLPANPVPGTRWVHLFFVEFGSGELSDNAGSTTVYYQPTEGGSIGSVVVSPVANVVFNCPDENPGVRNLSLSDHYRICATGSSQYAGEPGYYHGVFFCSQRGTETVLEAIPIDGPSVFLSATDLAGTNPGYLWFPEFGSGYLGDNSGLTQVCFEAIGTTSSILSSSENGSSRAALGVAAPNPASFGTTILFNQILEVDAPRLFEILDATGRRVRTIGSDALTTDRRSVRWDYRDDAGRLVPNGAYFLRTTDDGASAAIKVMIVH